MRKGTQGHQLHMGVSEDAQCSPSPCCVQMMTIFSPSESFVGPPPFVHLMSGYLAFMCVCWFEHESELKLGMHVK